MENFINKNEKQLFFSQVKGIVEEINDAEKYCSITIRVGHEVTRCVNLMVKKVQFDAIKTKLNLGDKITAKYYITSKKKNDRWFTTANALEIA